MNPGCPPRRGPAALTTRRNDFRGLASDALRAAEVLRDSPGVDPTRVGLMGWSEGGWVVAEAARLAGEDDRHPARGRPWAAAGDAYDSRPGLAAVTVPVLGIWVPRI